MKIVLEFNYNQFIDTIFLRIKQVFEKDGELIGHILAVFHVMIFGVLLTLVFVSHTVYPNVWLKFAIFIGLGCIFLQHVIFDVCIVSVWEKNLTLGKITPFHSVLEKILSVFGITLSEYDKYLLVIEGVAVSCFGLELLSHASIYSQTVDWNDLLRRTWHKTKLNVAEICNDIPNH